jgi:phosphoribosylaminoimidazolecarboxamide formyltransferase/IMP cyclohydrolase
MSYALLSVSDKTGIVDFAKALIGFGFELISTGGTSKTLAAAGLQVKDVSEITGFPEMMDGRVKTLHPKIHGGILHLRDNAEHLREAEKNGIKPIDLVCVNLYPFEKTAANPNASLEELIENIDIGGPAMLRSSAKNYRFVTIVTDPNDYPQLLSELKLGDVSLETREKLALKVFAHTSKYDSAIHDTLQAKLFQKKSVSIFLREGQALRYGENPHQTAWLFPQAETGASVPHGKLLHGKEMSYNNYLDAEASFETALEFVGENAAVVVKHGNPCGVATGKTLKRALEMAWEGDIVSAFGSVITLTQKVDLATAEFLKGKFVEVLIAPAFADGALDFLKTKSKDIRLIETGAFSKNDTDSLQVRKIRGAYLAQSADKGDVTGIKSVTKIAFPDSHLSLASFSVKAAKHIKSNAISICHEYEKGFSMLVGMGAGQPNRVDSTRKLAAPKARENFTRLYGAEKVDGLMASCVLASDAFFPFPDNIEIAHELGLRHILQPGGSVKDADVIAACDRLGLSMAVTGLRHFLH